jgi:hypothetical protein
VSDESEMRCRPSASKLPGSSHARKARSSAGHSRSIAAYHAVSRFRPLDTLLDERHLERQTEALCGRARRFVQRVALPLVAPIPERERVSHHEEHRLGRGGLALQERREVEAADLDRAVRRIDAEIARDADRAIARLLDDREEDRVVAGVHDVDPAAIVGQRLERPVGQIGPVPGLGVDRIRVEQGAPWRSASSGSRRQNRPAIVSRDGQGGGFQPATRKPTRWPSSFFSAIGFIARLSREVETRPRFEGAPGSTAAVTSIRFRYSQRIASDPSELLDRAACNCQPKRRPCK